MIVVNARFLTQSVTGVQRYAIEISRELKKVYQDNIVFVCPRNIMHQELVDELDAKIIGKHTGHLWEQLDLPQSLKKDGKPLLINFSNTAPIFYINKATTIHDITFIRFPNTFSKSFIALYRILIPLVIKTSKHIFTVSEFSKTEISNYYKVNLNKISVVYNAVTENFKHIEDEHLSQKQYFMAVSSVKGNKNFVFILEAFKRFSESNDNVELLIIGDMQSKSFRTLNIDKYLDNSRIKILGRISDENLIRYYSNATAFLFPSLYEGFGIPPLEAQACGCPVICSNTSCLPEIFEDSVLYCNPYDTDSMVETMKKITMDYYLRNSMIDKGIKNVRRYSWGKSALIISEKLKELY